MPRRTRSLPTYRLHRASGLAFVWINNGRVYLGKHGTDESRAEYNRIISEWTATRARLPSAAGKVTSGATPDIVILELIALYVDHVEAYYRRADGSPTSEVATIKEAMQPLLKLYGETPGATFGPLALKAVRQAMIAGGWCRTHVNRQMDRVKRMFRWATSEEYIPGSVLPALLSVRGLSKGRSEARESEPVKPVDVEHVRAIFDFIAPPIRAAIELQLLTGMRPGETIAMRGVDLDMTTAADKSIWLYRPPQHKTTHLEHARAIPLGKRCQEIITPFLKPDLSAYLFSPADAMDWHRQQRRAKRKTPLSCGNTAGTNRKATPERKPGARYAVESYAHAIEKACIKANRRAKGGRICRNEDVIVPHWHPHQIRHTVGKKMRKEFGLDVASIILGHKSLAITQTYAEADVARAIEVMGQVG